MKEMSMIPHWVRGLLCALALALVSMTAEAGETSATPVCGCCRRCYDPCQPVGPVRRFLRKVFLPRCPAPCPPACPLPVVIPPPAPAVFLPPAPPPAVPPANLDRPVPVVPPATPPAPPAAGPFPSPASRTPGLEPSPPPPPIRADRIASFTRVR
jgi:hypothetical protein